MQIFWVEEHDEEDESEKNLALHVAYFSGAVKIIIIIL